MCSAGAPCHRWTWRRCPAQSRTYGWPRGPKAWGWAGCRSSIPHDSSCCWGCPATPNPWRSCASALFLTSRPGRSWSSTVGRSPVRCANSFRRTAGRRQHRPRLAFVTVDLNADLGESFGVWRLGDDGAMLDVVTSANVACGFHAGDAATLARTCRAAAERGVRIGAQVSYRDLAGFGRRFIDATPEDLTADV